MTSSVYQSFGAYSSKYGSSAQFHASLWWRHVILWCEQNNAGHHQESRGGGAKPKRMGLLPDTQNCGLRMRREYRERLSRHWLQRKPSVSDPGLHHGTCVMHVPWCMPGSLTHGGGEMFPAFPAHAQPAVLRIWQEEHTQRVYAHNN